MKAIITTLDVEAGTISLAAADPQLEATEWEHLHDLFVGSVVVEVDVRAATQPASTAS